jgi:hypothetical protein
MSVLCMLATLRRYPSNGQPRRPFGSGTTAQTGVTASRLPTQRSSRLRERAVTDPRAAETVSRWLQSPKPVAETPGVDLDSMSIAELERLYAGLTRLAALPDEELQALVPSLLADKEDG